jgi:hypothetical protein
MVQQRMQVPPHSAPLTRPGRPLVGPSFLLVWIGFIVLTAVIAGSKNRSAGGWGLLAAFFGFFATIAVACCERLPTAQEIAVSRAANEPIKKCPRCAGSVKAAALVCRFCNHGASPLISLGRGLGIHAPLGSRRGSWRRLRGVSIQERQPRLQLQGREMEDQHLRQSKAGDRCN